MRMSPVVDPLTGTFKVTVEVLDFPASTRQGDFAEVSIVTDRHTDTVLVPQMAVLTEHDERFLFVADGEVAHRRLVEVGFEDDKHSEIVSGLEPGEKIIVQGQRSLSDGQAITVLERMDFSAETASDESSTSPQDG